MSLIDRVELPPIILGRKKLLVSRELWQELHFNFEKAVDRLPMIAGIEICLSQHLPTQSPVLKSCSRYMKFDVSDSDWAVAAGFAYWDSEPCHAVLIDDSWFRHLEFRPHLMKTSV